MRKLKNITSCEVCGKLVPYTISLSTPFTGATPNLCSACFRKRLKGLAKKVMKEAR